MRAGIPIFLASDDRFAPFVAVTIASIAYHTRSPVSFHILSDNISRFHEEQIHSLKKRFDTIDISFISVDADKHFADMPFCNGLTKASYSRLLIPDLARQYTKVLYSDVDIICLGDIAEFYEQDLGKYSIGAVDHAHYEAQPARQAQVYARLGLHPAHRYFYSGNLLLDCSRWRKLGIREKLFAMAREHGGQLTFGDQCLLNKFFDANQYTRLDYRFCLTTQDCAYFQNSRPEEYRRLMYDPVIRHFETNRKPWLTDLDAHGNPMPHWGDFWFFAEMTPFSSGIRQWFLAAVMQNALRPAPPSKAAPSISKQTKADMLAQLRARVAASSRCQA